MKEYPFSFSAPLRNGLTPFRENILNELYLKDGHGVVSRASGLVSYYPYFIGDADSYVQFIQWGNNLYKIKDSAIANTIKIYLSGVSDVEQDLVFRLYDPPGSSPYIAGQLRNDPYTIAKFASRVFATSDSSTLVIASNGTIYLNYTRGSICKFRDRLIWAAPYIRDTESIAELFQVWRSEVGADDMLGIASTDIPEAVNGYRSFSDYVFWSTQAGGDVENPFRLEEAFLGHTTEDIDLYSYLLSALREGRIGMTRVKNIGTIYKVGVLGDNILVFGSKGIRALSVVQREGKEFWLRPSFVSDRAPLNKGSIYCADNTCLYIAGDYLYRMTSDSHQRLRQLPADFSIATHIVKDFHRDGHYLTYWVSGNTNANQPNTSYYLEEDRLSRVGCCIIDMISVDGVQVPLSKEGYAPIASYEENQVYLKTGRINFSLAGMKMLRDVLLEQTGLDDVNVRATVWFDNTYNNTVVTGWVPFNDQGVAFLNAQGEAFMLEITGIAEGTVNISDLGLRWQYSDKRYIRGMYGNAAQTPANAG